MNDWDGEDRIVQRSRDKFVYQVVGMDEHDASWIVTAAADLLDATSRLPLVIQELIRDEYSELYEAMQTVGYTAQFPDDDDELVGSIVHEIEEQGE